jgi:hypothetical protein
MNFKILFLLIILLLIIYLKKNYKCTENFELLINNKIKHIYFFYNEKSKYSMDLIPIIQKIKKINTNKDKVIFHDINTDKLEDLENKNINIKRFNVKSIPRLILQNEKETTFNEYIGNNTLNDIIKFFKKHNIYLNESQLVHMNLSEQFM